MNSWIIFRQNDSDSAIKAQRLFRLKLIEELVQPLLDLRASPGCPQYLQNTKGRRPSFRKAFCMQECKKGKVLCMQSKTFTNNREKEGHENGKLLSKV